MTRPVLVPDVDRSAPGPVVLLTRDRALAAHVGALAEAVSTPLLVLADHGPAARAAAALLIGPDVAGELPGRAPGSVLVVRLDGADPPEGIWRQAVQLGVSRVVLLPEGESWLVAHLADAGSATVRAPVVGVLGGCGGAGASSLSLALAVTASERGLQVVLVDADPVGGGLDLPLGVDGVDGLRWPDLPWAAGRLPGGVLGAGLPRLGGLAVLSCTRERATSLTPEAVGATIDAAARESDVVVVDLPRRVGDAEEEVLRRCRRVLVVLPGTIRAIAAASLTVAAIDPFAADVRVVVRGPLPPGRTGEDVADTLLLPLQGELRPEPGLAGALDAGEAFALRPRGPLATLSRQVLADLLAP